MLLQGFTMLAELKDADGGGADLIPEALKSTLPNKLAHLNMFHSHNSMMWTQLRPTLAVSNRLLRLATGVPSGAGPQQRTAAEAGLQLALRLGLRVEVLLQALQAGRIEMTVVCCIVWCWPLCVVLATEAPAGYHACQAAGSETW